MIEIAVDQCAGISFRQDIAVDICDDCVVVLQIAGEDFRIFQNIQCLDIAAILHPHPVGQVFAVIAPMAGNYRQVHFVVIGVVLV